MKLPSRSNLSDQQLRLAVPLQHEDVAGRPYHRLVRLVKEAQVPVGVPLAGLALAAEHHGEPPGGIELVDQVRRHIRRPDVVVGVDAQTVRPLEQAVAEAADEIAVGIEFHQRHRPAMDDEDVALRIERDARRAAEIRAGRQAEGFGNGGVG